MEKISPKDYFKKLAFFIFMCIFVDVKKQI